MKFPWISLGLVPFAVVALGTDVPTSAPATTTEANGPACREIIALGRIEGATPEIEIRPRILGSVVKVLVKEGQFVDAGQVLLHLDDRRYRQEVTIAAANLDRAEAQLERLTNGARREKRAELAALCRAREAEVEVEQIRFTRIRHLKQTRAASQKTVDRQEALVTSLTGEARAARARRDLLEAPPRPGEIRIAEARIQAAEARLKLAEVQLQRTRLVAPRLGQILDVDAMVGELTGPRAERPAIVLADTSGFQVRAFVEEADAADVHVGMDARIMTDSLTGQEFHGSVTRLCPRVQRKQLWSDHPAERYDTRTREVWISLETTEPLVVGLRVWVVLDANPTQVPSNRQVAFGLPKSRKS